MAESLNLGHVATVIAVVDHGGFTRAARALHISQSTVSHHVRAVENRVGRPLFLRDHRGQTLTPDGHDFVHGAQLLLDAHDALIGRFDAPTTPALAIGCTEHAADRLLPQLLAGFREAHPGSDISFNLDRSWELVDAVARAELDLAVILATSSATAPGDRVGDLGLRWVAAPAALTRLLGESTLPLVAFDGRCGIRERALQRLHDDRRDARVQAAGSTLDAVISAARAGLGVALLPSSAEPPDGLVEVSGLPPAGEIGVHLVTRDGLDPADVRIAHRVTRALLDAHAAGPHPPRDSPFPPPRPQGAAAAATR
ncbi:LysR family transcriptional regulator [Gordonia soli]|uniref:Putative LysR family transcriptional regulator n=1 Tax=Gordonia soli NBRC 108243 TaxID=1223545 RepID=M0QGU8_9ACTN|nr:LysR family transcriptional regulator [Gordonia soli]GAC66642.1 putative LysR family transcriptional regulator [Gordonia soli NBRC 108243]